MTNFDKTPISAVTSNLDSKRIPLNAEERKLKAKNPIYPYVGANNILDYIDEYIFEEKILCVAEDGGSWGRNEQCSFVIDEKCWVNNHAHVLTAKDNLHLEYLCYYLNFADLSLHITGATRGKLNKGVLNKIQIPLPPLKTQKRIATILDDAQALKQKNEQLLKEYDELAQSIFLDMFGDPVTNPKGWDLVKFGSVGVLERGKSKHRPRNAPELLGGKYPLIQTGDVANSGGYITTYNSTYSELGLSQSRMWEKGTLCITIAANIARTGILTFDACFPDSVVGFKPTDHTNNEFVQMWLSFLQKIIEEGAPVSAQKNINLRILRGLDIISPPINLQNQFAEKIKLIEQQKELLKKELKESEDLFQVLLQKAFKGELIE